GRISGKIRAGAASGGRASAMRFSSMRASATSGAGALERARSLSRNRPGTTCVLRIRLSRLGQQMGDPVGRSACGLPVVLKGEGNAARGAGGWADLVDDLGGGRR